MDLPDGSYKGHQTRGLVMIYHNDDVYVTGAIAPIPHVGLSIEATIVDGELKQTCSTFEAVQMPRTNQMYFHACPSCGTVDQCDHDKRKTWQNFVEVLRKLNAQADAISRERNEIGGVVEKLGEDSLKYRLQQDRLLNDN